MFKDDKLQTYYSNQNKYRKKKHVLIMQRIQDSPSFILLFPTGLIMHFSQLFPITKQSQI
jgi:hypothetical protein